MTKHTITLPYTPEPIKEFFDAIIRIEDKIGRGEDFTDEINKMTNGSTEIPQGLQGLRGKYE